MPKRIRCPRCHIPTTDLVNLKGLDRGSSKDQKVCRACYNTLKTEPSARIDSYALAKHTKGGFKCGQQILAAAKLLGFNYEKSYNPNGRSRQCGGSFEEILGDNIQYFYETMHANWRTLMKVHAGDAEHQRSLNAAMVAVEKWCEKRGLR